jgi:myo-inositol-1(or 4)-monophosphatase
LFNLSEVKAVNTVKPVLPPGCTLQYFVNLARQAGGIMLSNFQLGMAQEWKEDDSPITATDKAINQLVIDTVSRDFPTFRVVGEEGSNGVTEGDWMVIFDPVDGTGGFSTGIPTFCFSGAVLYQGQPVFAVIYDPFLDRMFTAEKDGGAWLNDRQIFVSKKAEIKRSKTCVAFWNGCKFNMTEVFCEVVKAGASFQAPLSIAYWAALVAAGELDATIFPSTNAWETAAIKLLVEEAGGMVTDVFGNWQERYDGEIRGHIASNGTTLHNELMRITRRVNGIQSPTL